MRLLGNFLVNYQVCVTTRVLAPAFVAKAQVAGATKHPNANDWVMVAMLATKPKVNVVTEQLQDAWHLGVSGEDRPMEGGASCPREQVDAIF